MTPRVVLIGPMGAGKSTVGRLLAERWGVAFRDTDADIEAAEGREISDIFVDSGEAHFRALEKAAVAGALAEHEGVLALGGGAVLDPDTRTLLAGHHVVFLRVGLSDAVKRVGLGTSRPLLLGNVRATIKGLLDERTPVYESVATHAVTTDDRAPEEVADEIVGLLPTRMHVGGESPYDVVVGRLSDDQLAEALGSMLTGALGHGVRRVGLLHADVPGLADQVTRVRAALDVPQVVDLVVPDGETGKSAETAAACWERLGAAGFTRSDAIVAVGGGAVTDLGGFVAATWLRGVPVVQVPTTVLAMVDAAVGGKTGINTSAGKNLVGAFHEPAGVICDLTTLDTLPAAERRAGLGEVVKCGFIADPAILDIVEACPPGGPEPGSPELRELIERAIGVKIEVVVADLREAGGAGGHPGREVLNYGHTMAHAIERASAYAVRHGEAVAIGSCYVAEVAARAGSLPADVVARHRAAFSRVGLPTTWAGAPYDELLAAMKVDKKSRGDLIRFVVLDDLAEPRILAGPDEETLRAAYDVMTGEAR